MSVAKKLFLLGYLLFIPFYCNAEDQDIVSIKALVSRILPKHESQFEFTKSKSKTKSDAYTLESGKDGRIHIAGNNANSMAVALNYYLNNYCHTTVSWYAEVPVVVPDKLPGVPTLVKSNAKVERRFFLNYCTYGYTMPFFSWKEWERLIDWMALNGVNMPLAITGQEAVWYAVWKNMGMSDIEIRGYFTGPTYLPWNRMANIDKWNGPLPMFWLEQQKELQQRILLRERSLNMKPVLPAFSGHVPAKLKELYPQANIKYLGRWASFSDDYRCHFLNPEDPLFAKIQKMYLEEQKALFGTDHIYGIDPFNEVDPPSWKPEYLKEISHNIYRTVTSVDPGAEWMQMSWMFYHNKKQWTPKRIKALLTGVPRGKMSLLDYHCENVELWKTTNNFYGQPYIWCYLGNFGGNTTITGNVKESGQRLNEALNKKNKNLIGIGSTLEGLDVIQFPYEYILTQAWTAKPADKEWIDNLADRHVGFSSPKMRQAWQILFNDIYTQIPRSLGILPALRPILGKSQERRTGITYPTKRLEEVWKLMSDVSECDRNEYLLDLIAVGRQVLGNKFLKLKLELDSCYENKDLVGLQRTGNTMKEILVDLDYLTAGNSRCSIGKWIDDARDYGNNDLEKAYYEKNARNLITTWGGSLNDYANRTWSGLIRTYYVRRWSMYIDELTASVMSGKPFDQQQLDKTIGEFEQNWVNSTEKIDCIETSHVQQFCRYLIKKYGI